DVCDWVASGQYHDPENRHGEKSVSYLVGGEVIIETLEGRMTADIGDYVIKGVKGGFYPCKPDIFHATYDRVPVREPSDAEVSWGPVSDTPEPPPSTQRRVDVSDDDPSELRGVRLMREGIEANEANASAGNPPVESLRGVDRRHPRFRCRRRGRTTRDGRAAPEARSTDET